MRVLFIFLIALAALTLAVSVGLPAMDALGRVAEVLKLLGM